jgi:pyruvate,water dikinase
LILRRREEHERNQTVRLPETFTGRPIPILHEEKVTPTHVLKGLPVSPGRVTGPARVILDPREDAHLEEGEILVAPVTDTGWTPLFILAKGLVVDIGGLLSHGSIVAREYGIPGVLNVMVGTKLIKTGQIITVDGAKGEVYLHEE